MTDEELCKGLRLLCFIPTTQAADRIEALTAKLAKAEAGLLAIAKRDEQMIWGEDYEVEEAFKDMRDIACATLAEIKVT
jgi:hypothetical protein